MIAMDYRARAPSGRVSTQPTTYVDPYFHEIIPIVRDPDQPLTANFCSINRNINGPLALRDREAYVTCPYCLNRRLTRIEFSPTWKTHLIALMLCVFGCWCCACTPYLVESCVNIRHYCGNCDRYIGTYTPRGVVQN